MTSARNPKLHSLRLAEGRQHMTKFYYEELLSVVTLLFGELVEEGKMSPRDFYTYSAKDFERILYMRASQYRSRRLALEQQAQQKQQAMENAFLEQLKKATR